MLSARAVGFRVIRGNFSLNHDLCRGRNYQIHGFTRHHLDRLPGNPSGNLELAHPVGNFGHTDHRHGGHRSKDRGHLQRKTPLSAFVPMDRQVRRRTTTQVGSVRAELQAVISPHVDNARVRIL